RSHATAMNRSQSRRVWMSRVCLLWIAVLIVPAMDYPAWGQSSHGLRIYLARHGETDWNAEHRLQGSTDTALNSTGLKQAAQLAESLKGIHFDAVYSSTLRRSRDTAEIVRGATPLKTLAALNERSVGKFEGNVLDRRKDPATAQEYPKRSRDPDDEL